MASRRPRLKAVINLPVRRGREPEPSPSSINKETGISEQDKSAVQVVSEESDNSVISENAGETSPGSVRKNANKESKPADKSAVSDVLLQDESSNSKSINNSQSPVKIIGRKRLKPAVNLPILSRRPKNSDTQVDTAVKLNSVSTASSVVGITRLGNKKTDSGTTLHKNEESDDVPGSSASSYYPNKSSNVNSSKLLASQDKFEFIKPSPRLGDSPSRRAGPSTSAGIVEQSKMASTFSTQESEDMVSNIPMLVTQHSEMLPPIREQSIHSSAASSCSSIYDDTIEADFADSSKSEKRTTHRRLPKSGVAEQLVRARRDFQSRFGNKTPDRNKLKMFDLIYYNPVANPMKITEIKDEKPRKSPVKADDEIALRLAEESIDDVTEIEEESTAMPAPQVKVGPDGSLIIDEKSLVIETTGSKKRKDDLANSAVVMEYGVGNTTYNSFSKRARAHSWTEDETMKFYRAIHTMGTDFLLMQQIFPNRSRRDLKTKFKKEDRLHRELIDKALRNPLKFDYAMLVKEEQEEEKEKELEKEKIVKKKGNGLTKSFLGADLCPEDAGKPRLKRKRGGLSRRKLSGSDVEGTAEGPVPRKKRNARSTKKSTKKSKKRNEHVSSDATTDESECCLVSDDDAPVKKDIRSKVSSKKDVRQTITTEDSLCADHPSPANESTVTVIAIESMATNDSSCTIAPVGSTDSIVTLDSTVEMDSIVTVDSLVPVESIFTIDTVIPVDSIVTTDSLVEVDCIVPVNSAVVVDPVITAGSAVDSPLTVVSTDVVDSAIRVESSGMVESAVTEVSAAMVGPSVTVESAGRVDSAVAVNTTNVQDMHTVKAPLRRDRLPVLSTADDIDSSSTDDEEKFLKTTRQTRYGRIPQRRVLSSSSSSDESEEDVDLDSSTASSNTGTDLAVPSDQTQEFVPFVPVLSHVEPGSLVMFTTPGQDSYHLFMVGPKNNEDMGTSSVTTIPVSAAPEILASISSNTGIKDDSAISSGEDQNIANDESVTNDVSI